MAADCRNSANSTVTINVAAALTPIAASVPSMSAGGVT